MKNMLNNKLIRSRMIEVMKNMLNNKHIRSRAYLPSLSVAWLFQRAMSIRVGARTRPDFINQLLGQNFAALESLGPWALRPFLQDVVQFGPLGLALGKMMLGDPAFTLTILRELGPGPVLEWLGHFLALGLYAGLHRTASPALAKLAPTLLTIGSVHLPLPPKWLLHGASQNIAP